MRNEKQISSFLEIPIQPSSSCSVSLTCLLLLLLLAHNPRGRVFSPETKRCDCGGELRCVRQEDSMVYDAMTIQRHDNKTQRERQVEKWQKKSFVHFFSLLLRIVEEVYEGRNNAKSLLNEDYETLFASLSVALLLVGGPLDSMQFHCFSHLLRQSRTK